MYINKEDLRKEIDNSIKLSSELTTELINLKSINTIKNNTRISREDKKSINSACVQVLRMVGNIYKKFNYLERTEHLCQE